MARSPGRFRWTIYIVEWVIELGEARRRAEARLAEIEGSGAIKMALTGEQEFADGWVFFYDSIQHLNTGALADSIVGNSPILVDRETGDTHGTGTAHPVEFYIIQFSERKRRAREGWPQGLDARLCYLLRLVSEGADKRDARALGLYVNTKYPPRAAHHVRDELLELEGRGLVCRLPESERGVGSFWAITSVGLDALQAEPA